MTFARQRLFDWLQRTLVIAAVFAALWYRSEITQYYAEMDAEERNELLKHLFVNEGTLPIILLLIAIPAALLVTAIDYVRDICSRMKNGCSARLRRWNQIWKSQDGLRWARGLAQLAAPEAASEPSDDRPDTADIEWTTVVYASAAGPDACETQVVETLGAAIAAVDQLVMDDVGP